jgi:microcompartment protein CcmL/EutN
VALPSTSSVTAAFGPALVLVEIGNIARGFVVADTLVKRAEVRLLRSHAIDPGKYLIVFSGPVADVEEALDAAETAAKGTVVDRLYLPNAHDHVGPAIAGRHTIPDIDALGIVETHTLAGAVLGLDKSLKVANVQVVELRLGAGLGGKGYFVLTGDLYDVEAAVESAVALVGNDAMSEIIARPHPDFLRGALGLR